MAQLQILYKARGRKLEELTNDLHILKEDSSREIRWVKLKIFSSLKDYGLVRKVLMT